MFQVGDLITRNKSSEAVTPRNSFYHVDYRGCFTRHLLPDDTYLVTQVEPKMLSVFGTGREFFFMKLYSMKEKMPVGYQTNGDPASDFKLVQNG